jgi:hypothetical protein
MVIPKRFAGRKTDDPGKNQPGLKEDETDECIKGKI